MIDLRIPTVLVALLSSSTIAHAQDPPKPEAEAKVQAPAKPAEPAVPDPNQRTIVELKDDIKPLPPVAIPDDPPPHEGALIDIPMTIEPPDMIVVEVLEAMPGRPITGERLIRPDGTISLGFYGDVHVRGLTLEQAKAKVVLRLRKYIPDEVLGLLRLEEEIAEEMPGGRDPVPAPNPGRAPFDLDDKEEKPAAKPGNAPPPEAKPGPEAKPAEEPEGRSTTPPRPRGRATRTRSLRRVRPTSAQLSPTAEPVQKPGTEKPTEPSEKPEMPPGPEPKVRFEDRWIVVSPAETDRVFVDIVAHNTKVYYVQGDVGVPGRLPVTGKETVLDAINYAGGLIPSAEPADIHLYRPARGGKPAKDYKIDLDAIYRGDATANLQMFPNDRLIVGRNPIVKKTVEMDRANSLINSTAATSRDNLIRDWAEFLWAISAQGGQAMLDEQAFKEALMKKLSRPGDPK